MTDTTEKEIIKYFRGNIFEALSAYNGWKMLAYSKSNAIVSQEMATRYVEIQNYHKDFFIITERSLLISFILLALHPLDKDRNAYSLFKIDEEKTLKFIEANQAVIDALRLVRNKVFAHKDASAVDLTIPPIELIDQFFEKLTAFYNELSKGVDQSLTIFDNANNIKRDIENLFMNLYRGEASRKQEIDIEWSWKQDSRKASDSL